MQAAVKELIKARFYEVITPLLDSEPEDEPPAKKVKKEVKREADEDAKLAAKLQAEENGRGARDEGRRG